jgi:hypothetical protein
LLIESRTQGSPA